MTGTLLFLGLGMQEILFIALIVLLFFGGKKIRVSGFSWLVSFLLSV